jgi:Carbohydrate esterase, sialic acid-specific acetylesterase
MKKTYIFIILIFVLLKSQTVVGQYLQLSYPVYQGVYQRDASNNANIPVSGQVFGFPTSTPGTYKIECITNRLDANGTVISGTTSTTLITNNTLKGYFNGSITRAKGWYSLQVKFTFNSTGYNSSTTSKFGVGDVFIIAGQSNGQGDNGATTTTTAIPEWIVGNNEEWNCRKEFESRPSMTKISGTNLIGPSGNNSWCYGVLGKKISDANGGMPVAFFNTCAGGSSVKNWSEGANGSPTLGYQNGGVQWCSNFPALSGNPVGYFYGQPYLTLKNNLNWYVPLFGVRAVLWHQGEADADNTSTNSVLSRTGTLYRDYLNNVIAKSRDHSSISNLSWMIAKVSYSTFNTAGGTFDVIPSGTTQAENYAKNVRDSQGNSPTGVVTGSTLAGPITDRYNSASTGIYRYDNTHFSEGNSSGLTVLSNLWGNFIDPSSLTAFNRISPKAVPAVLITQSGSTYTFSVSAVSNSDYCWMSGNTLAPPTSSLSCLGTGTSITSSSSGCHRFGCSSKLPRLS